MSDERSLPTGAWLIAALAAALLTWHAISDWSSAPDVPAARGFASVSLYRGVVFGVDLLLAGMLVARAMGGALVIPSRWLMVAALAIGVALEASGKLRAGVLAVAGKVPGGPTRLQTHQRAIADLRAQAQRAYGDPLAIDDLVGRWTKQGTGMLQDVRRVELRRAGDGLVARVAIECREGGALCEMPEVPALVERTGDGRVQAVAATGTAPLGRYWVLLAPGRHKSQPMFMSTHVMVENDAWQVSSGPWASVALERDPVPLERFAGAWRSTGSVLTGDLTRLTVSIAGNVTVQAWVRCPQTQECELGSAAGKAEPGGSAGASRIDASFTHANATRTLTLEPRADGALDARIESSTYSHTTEVHRRAPRATPTTRTYVSGRASSTRSSVLVREGS
ncbi:MAG: hypothetical protein ACT4P9_10070 [Betaproteobacteria bacterium]